MIKVIMLLYFKHIIRLVMAIIIIIRRRTLTRSRRHATLFNVGSFLNNHNNCGCDFIGNQHIASITLRLPSTCRFVSAAVWEKVRSVMGLRTSPRSSLSSGQEVMTNLQTRFPSLSDDEFSGSDRRTSQVYFSLDEESNAGREQDFIPGKSASGDSGGR